MEKDFFGRLPFRVSRFCLGTGTSGNAQSRVPLDEYARVLRRAFELGISFWDSSDNYGTHPHIRLALQSVDRSEVILATKTWEREGHKARQSLEKSLAELDTLYVDLFLLHGVRSEEWPQSMDAILALQQAKKEGLVRAVGITTHDVAVVEAVADVPEVDVIYTTVNKTGYYVEGGGLDQMIDATRRCFFAGKGVVIMKTLAEGNGVGDIEDALRYSFEFPYAHSVLVGIMNEDELEVDVRLVQGQEIPEEALAELRARRTQQGAYPNTPPNVSPKGS